MAAQGISIGARIDRAEHEAPVDDELPTATGHTESRIATVIADSGLGIGPRADLPPAHVALFLSPDVRGAAVEGPSLVTVGNDEGSPTGIDGLVVDRTAVAIQARRAGADVVGPLERDCAIRHVVGTWNDGEPTAAGATEREVRGVLLDRSTDCLANPLAVDDLTEPCEWKSRIVIFSNSGKGADEPTSKPPVV